MADLEGVQWPHDRRYDRTWIRPRPFRAAYIRGMGKVDQKNALALCARELRLGFEDRMSSAGLRFQLATRSRLTLRGMERGLDLQVWPAAGMDDFYEAFAARTWLGKSIEIGSVPSVCTRFAEILERYLSGETPPFASEASRPR